jgi:prepilin-type N-terminal cleavage/methylation domain-containing protein
MRTTRDIKGLTLVELLVALVVTSIILSGVATLAFAMNAASNAGDDVAMSQARLRYATLRLLDLIRDCNLICAAPGNDLVVWRADDNGNNLIDVDEIVYIERGADLSMLRLCSFETAGSHLMTLSDLADADTKSSLISGYDEQFILIIPDCNQVSFTCHRDDIDDRLPQTKRVTIAFDLTENGGVHHYEINATLRAWAGHLLNENGTALVEKDDD